MNSFFEPEDPVPVSGPQLIDSSFDSSSTSRENKSNLEQTLRKKQQMLADLRNKANRLRTVKQTRPAVQDSLDSTLNSSSGSMRERSKKQNGKNSNEKALKQLTEELQKDKEQLIATLGTKNAYIKRLEAKLATGARSSGFAEKYGNLEAKISRLKERCQSQEETIKHQQTQIKQLEQEVTVLTHSLEVRADEIGLEGDFKSVLLYDIGKCQEENHRLKNTIKAQTSEILASDRTIKDFKYKTEQLQQELEQTQAKMTSNQDELDKVNAEMYEYRNDLNELRSKKELLEQQIEEYSDHNEYLKNKVERMSSSLEDAEASRHVSEEEASKVKQELEEAMEKISKMKTVQDLTEDKIHELRQEIRESSQQLEETRKERDCLSKRLTECEEDLERVMKLKDKLESDFANEQIAKEQLESKEKETAESVSRLETDLQNLKELKAQSERDLRRRLGSSLEEVQTLIDQRDTAAQERDELKKLIQDNEQNVLQVAQENRELSESLEHMKDKQSLLQKTLLDQINSVKDKLSRAQNENDTLNSKLKKLEREKARYEIIVNARKRREGILSKSESDNSEANTKLATSAYV